MTRQQLENIFTTPPASIPIPISVSRPRTRPRTIHRTRPRLAIRFPPSQRSRLRRTPEPLRIDEPEKLEMAETRPVTENTWYQLYDWLINHIPESMKKSERDTKQ